MRDTIDFGIDLGTTNSAIAVADDGVVSVIQNRDWHDVTPSAVWIDKRRGISVGNEARGRVEKDPANAVAEFKQTMGLANAGMQFANAGLTLTPQQLSAEVLKSLRADVMLRRNESPDCAVITVPAAFTLDQNQATTDAAEMAGLGLACPLVPEPTAAAFAYGLNDNADRGYWMVFDFGGGTFDAAVVSKRDGELRVLNHAGDPYLGGKLIDWVLVERILAPVAARELGLSEFHRGNPRWKIAFAGLKGAAERLKIALSLQNQASTPHEIITDGKNSETIELILRRDELDALAEPFYNRAINLCRDALAKTALDANDIDRLLLVGGTTLMPGLRERLADPQHGLGIELDFSVDPTTVVARGAAIFASTIRRPQTSTPAPASGEFAVSLSYEPRVSTRTTTVAGTLHSSSTVDWTTYSAVVSNPSSRPPFRSPRVPLNAKGAFATEVDVDSHGTSRYTIELFDGTGTPCELSPSTFSITHGDEFDGVKLGHSLGIQLHDRTFAPMLRKNAALPTKANEPFYTAAALRRTDTEAVIRIPVVQGERRRADRNREVGTLQIRPRDLRIDLPAGSKIDVTFEVNTSNLVTVIADVPLIDAQFEAEIDMSGLRAQSREVLEIMLIETQQRLESLRATAVSGKSAEAERRLTKLDDEGAMAIAREQVQAAETDVSAAKYAEERLRDIQAELDDIEDALKLPDLVQDLQDALREARRLVDESGGPADRKELDALTNRAQDAIRAQDAAAVQEQTDRVIEFVFELERRTPDWPVKLFYGIQHHLPGPSRAADALTLRGERAIAAGDHRELTEVNRQLIGLLPPEEQAKHIGVTKR